MKDVFSDATGREDALKKLLRTITINYPEAGNDIVEKIRYLEPKSTEINGRIYINQTQYFENVPPQIWNFYIGGYQVCQKWLKDRIGRQLGYDDLIHYQNIVGSISGTIDLMERIDTIIARSGGFPLI
jgi:Type ISP C-terminal specificity domain